MPRQSSKRPPAPPAPDGDTEARILDAAHAVFMRTGTHGARMQEIAREAGVNHALLHYYFRSKERLAEAVFRRAATQLFPPVLEALASDATIEEKVARVVATEIDVLSRAPLLPGYILAEINHHPERAGQLIGSLTGLQTQGIAPRLFGTLGKQIEERVRAGTMRPITPDQFLINLVSLCIFPFAARPMLTAVLGVDEAAFARMMKRRRTELVAFFLAGLRP